MEERILKSHKISLFNRSSGIISGRTPLEGDAQSSPAGEGSADACTSDVYGKESTDRAEGLQAGGSPRDEVGLHIL